MRQVAGRLRLDLAQYRELVAFAQIGSDLDKATMARLVRGERMTEILKQGQYVPMPVEEQVAVIYAGVNGFLDKLPVEAVLDFEKEYLRFLKNEHPEILSEIREKKVLSDDLIERMNKVIKGFMDEFSAAFSIQRTA
jgi:F-type H+-transporting ATPase subunit alpha